MLYPLARNIRLRNDKPTMLTPRLLLQYAVLGGVPLAGVLAVMHAGSQLTPPESIQGVWHFEADLVSNTGTPCADRLTGFREPTIKISQSGVFLEVELPTKANDRLSGRLEHGRVLAEAAPALFGADVFDLLRLSGSISSEQGKKVMRGVLAMPRRIDCVPVPFVATAQPATDTHMR